MLPDTDVERAFSVSSQLGITAVFYSGKGYPDQLLDVPDPPAVLFYRGRYSPSELSPAIAVIGSRRCSLYGRKTARKISMELSRSGVCVVSGLARGIDGEAHRGALDGGSPTAAVMGGGLDVIYPPEHGSLAERIARQGCLISEYPPGIKPARYTFPERNRIISGLSKAVVVVEAGERSGTMITVATALDQGRDVFAVPGDITRSSTRGTNRLLRDGAGIVLSPEELAEELGFNSPVVSARPASDPVLAALAGKHITAQQLSLDLRQDTSTVNSRLLELELQGLVIRIPGGLYTLV
ncbi:MAG: DNA protecting protein DprA [Gemmatimonadaceae bacterium 4484_173]|nr:MAG: DNA protecting protein DprA [Gemmatimonadaceae bacterium 4484_173]RKZ03725.1 MAG: DNA-protecting protein DprA [Candidatus Fermentibacteria bacterium]